MPTSPRQERHHARYRVLVYSDDATTREQVLLGLGTRPDPDLLALEFVEVATAPMVTAAIAAGGIDLAVLDGEAVPAGGMGIAKELRDEFDPCPPILLLIGRPDDAWLAKWSQADAAVSHPVDPLRLTSAVVPLLSGRIPAAIAAAAGLDTPNRP
ncbi:MAG TPA: hypothetical protein VIW24_25175 [Aldersonia sp.]